MDQKSPTHHNEGLHSTNDRSMTTTSEKNSLLHREVLEDLAALTGGYVHDPTAPDPIVYYIKRGGNLTVTALDTRTCASRKPCCLKTLVGCNTSDALLGFAPAVGAEVRMDGVLHVVESIEGEN